MKKGKKWNKQIKNIFFVSGSLVFAMVVLYVFIFVDFGYKSAQNYFVSESDLIQIQEEWAEVFNVEEIFEFALPPAGVIVPNDKNSFGKLASFYGGLQAVKAPENIVLFGDNKNNLGPADIQICKNCVLYAPDGSINVLQNIASDLNSRNIAKINDDIFSQQDSINNQTPFINHYFPDARVLPVVLKQNTKVEDIIKLRDWLYNNLQGETLIIASTNFSDRLLQPIAELHDYTAFSSINSFDFNSLYSLDADSPASIYAVMSFMDRYENRDANLVYAFNTQELFDEQLDNVRSFLFWTFTSTVQGDDNLIPEVIDAIDDVQSEDLDLNYPVSSKRFTNGISILATGSLHEGAELFLRQGWIFQDEYDSTKDKSSLKQLRDVRETQDRFLRGFNFLAFDLQNEGCTEYNQNEFKIAFCKFSEKSEYSQSQKALVIREFDAKNDFVFLIYEFTGGELSKERIKLAENFVDYGVNVFAGRGLKELSPMKKYKDGLIFYSLGDFLTSSKLANEFTANSSGLMVGLFLSSDEYIFNLMPIRITSGYPKHLSKSERMNFFIEYTRELSLPPEVLEGDVVSGVFTIAR